MHRPSGEVWNSSQFAGTTNLIVACWLWPFQLAVIVALWLPLTDPELAEKAALLWPAGMIMLAGTVSSPLSLASDTVAALVAEVLKVTAQLLDALLLSIEGVQTSDVSCTGDGAVVVSVKLWETPFSVAVSTAD